MLYLVFFFSGCSALIFETLWFRLAGLVFGNSVWASSIVLGSFMSGLGLGSYLVARHGARISRPLVMFAAIEILVGATGLALVAGFPALSGTLAPIFQSLSDNPTITNLVRLSVSFLLFLVPATAMGATLPILIQVFSTRSVDFGVTLGRLYGVNTIGAMSGAILCEILLIPTLGIRLTGVAAALFNLCAATIVYLMSRGAASETPDPSYRGKVENSGGDIFRHCMAAGLCGAALLALEVVWMRYLLLFVDGTSMAFAIVLAVVLGGISIGGWLASLASSRYSYSLAPHIALAAVVLVCFCYIAASGEYGDAWARDHPLRTLVLASLLTLPVSVCSGMLFTFIGRSMQECIGNKMRATAMLALTNTAGAALGSIAAGFILIPFLGLENSFFALAFAYGIVAMLTVDATLFRTRHPYRLAVAGLGTLVLLSLMFYPFGLMGNYVVPKVVKPLSEEGSSIEGIREGRTETAIYLRTDHLGIPLRHRLLTNGHSMSGSSIQSRRYMRLYAYFPYAIHPAPKNALLICYGVGNTASALTDSDGLESIDIVDISRDILDLSKKVTTFPTDHPLDDPRVRVHIEDGRFFLQTTSNVYDIITAEPPPPRQMGVTNLYSKEYFHLVRSRLAEGGIVTYWLPVDQLHTSEAKAITAAFLNAFPDATMWSGCGSELMLVGTRELNTRVPEKHFAKLWNDDKIGPKLAEIGLEQPEDLGALFLAGSSDLREWTGNTEPLEDNFPARLRSQGPKERSSLGYLDPMYLERFKKSDFVQRIWPESLRESTVGQFRYQAYLNEYMSGNQISVPHLADLLTSTERRFIPLILMNAEPRYLKLLQAAQKQGGTTYLVEYVRGASMLNDRNYLGASETFQKLYAADPTVKQTQRLMILSTALAGDKTKTRQMLEKLGEPATSLYIEEILWK